MQRNQTLRTILWIVVAILLILCGYYYIQGDVEKAISTFIIPLALAVFGGIFQVVLQSNQDVDANGAPISSRGFKNKDFQKQYFTLLGYQNRDFDIKGLSTQTVHTLELEQVFVELKLQPQAPHKATADPLNNIPGEMRSDSYPIWQFFTMLSENEKSQNAKIVLVGPPGSGKTTLLRHITLLLATPLKNEANKKLKLKKIPILLFLRDHVSDVVNRPDILLPEIIESTITKWDVAVPSEWFNKKMKSGECLIMLDGLDEVAEPLARRQMVAWLEKQIRAYPNNTFIVTSRPHGYRENPITGVSVLEVLPFNRSQIDHFVQSWYLANEIKSHIADDLGVRMAAKSGADDLLNRLEKAPTLMELAVNPLLLTMIATVHRYRSALPGRRVELYKEICEVFLGKRQESKGLTIDLIPVQKQTVLQSLAYEMMCKNVREIRSGDAVEIIRAPLSLVKSGLNPVDFLKNVEQQSGLLLERENGVYGFAHKTFQEYLASMFILEQKKETELYLRINDDWWHEVIKLYSAQTDATEVITACLDQDPPSALALSLAIQCLEEARQVQPEIRAITQKILQENAEDADPEIRKIVAQALLANRLKHLFALSPSVAIDTKPISNAEYQLFVDEMLGQGFDYSLPHWVENQFPAGSAHAFATGLTPTQALGFCSWLTEINAGSGQWYFRLPVASEIHEHNYSDAPGFWLLKDIAKTKSGSFIPVDLWQNPKLARQAVPGEFLRKNAEQDIRNVISLVQVDGRNIAGLANVYANINSVLKSMYQNLIPKNNSIHADVANELYKLITSTPLSRAVDFGYAEGDIDAFDQSISDSIDLIKDKDFGNVVMEALGHFSNLATKRSANKIDTRYHFLYLAFTFEFLVKWIERNNTFLMRVKTEGFKRKTDYLVDQYLDHLLVYARQNGVVSAFEGLIIVKEEKESPIH
jgi:hypothetical protein